MNSIIPVSYTHLPGSARNDAIAFGLSDKGYLGSGYNGNYLKDFYTYNPSTDSWEQIVSLGGSKRRGAACFVIDNIAYVCAGFNTYNSSIKLQNI